MKISIQHNRGARIGHQLSNYLSVLIFCKLNEAKFCYSPFSGNSEKWNDVLRFDLLYDQEVIENGTHVTSFNDASNKNKNFIIDFDQEQFDYKSTPANKQIKLKLYDEHREKLYQIYQNKNPYKTTNNIAIHIRRGDVNQQNHPGRFLPIEYYSKILEQIYDNQNIYIVSEKNLESTDSFDKYNPKTLRDITAIEAFYYMANSDTLICSKSGFSSLAHMLGHSKCYYSHEDWSEYRDDAIKVS